MAREAKVIIRLDESIKTKFQQVAEERGMTISALGSYVIGTWVNEEEHKKDLQERLTLSLKSDILQVAKEFQIQELNRP